MIAALGRRLSRWAERFVPSPFVLAMALTMLTLVLAAFFGRDVSGLAWPGAMAELGAGWFDGFTGAAGMKFALQMTLVLVTGHAIAISEPVQEAIDALTVQYESAGPAVVTVALVACAASFVHWGIGLILGAFVAREMGRALDRRDVAVHYPILGAAGYAGFMVWHGGLSGSAPLKVAETAEQGNFVIGILGDSIPVSETIFSPLNLVLAATLFSLIPLLFWSLHPEDEEECEAASLSAESVSERSEVETGHYHSVVETLEATPLVNVTVAVVIGSFLVYFFAVRGVDGWTLDSLNVAFIGLSMVLYRTPGEFVDAISDGARGAAGIILQFPFYFGILGVLKASGLVGQIAEFFVQISTQTTFPMFTFLSAGIVNFFVPSGGGQWAVQGPVMMEAATRLGIDPSRIIVAFSYGDAWTNMLQPFWALPLLGIMELEAREIVGYTVLLMVISGPLMMLILGFFP